jgi:hypothetical protein
MELKLFRSTGYSSILAPGETRFALHPTWFILALSLWVGIVCNMRLWSAIANSGEGLRDALLMGAGAAGAVGFVLSVLGWRRTLKTAAVVVVAFAAWAACGWIETGLSMLVPMSALLHWKTAIVFAALFIPPCVWLCRTPLRRLAGGAQLASNLAGAAAGLVVFGLAFLALRLT